MEREDNDEEGVEKGRRRMVWIGRIMIGGYREGVKRENVEREGV